MPSPAAPGGRIGRPAVMADVARLAGVSHMTVSRVINDHPAVSSATRQRVLAAMSELAYRPNIAARTLVTGRTRRLGVISVDPALYGPASMLVGIERAARDAGYAISAASLPSLDRRSLGEAVEFLASQAVEGIIAITPHVATTAALRHVPVTVPMVAVEGGRGSVPTVAVDQYQGAQQATWHLLALGHDTVAHIAGPDGWFEARERERGWRDALLAEGRRVPEVIRGDWSARSGYQAINQLIRTSGLVGQAGQTSDLVGADPVGRGSGLVRQPGADRVPQAEPGVSALFVANDQMALGALRALHEARIPVPERVSVVGFDDIPEAAYFTPPLTTLRQDFGEVGRRGLGLLLEQVEGAPRNGRRIVIPAQLVVRRSTTDHRYGRPAPATVASVGTGPTTVAGTDPVAGTGTGAGTDPGTGTGGGVGADSAGEQELTAMKGTD